MSKTSNNDEEIKLLSKNLCMHERYEPEFIDINDLNNEIIDKEKNIQKMVLNSGKPSSIVEKILEENEKILKKLHF